jgi:putative transposase
MSIDWIPVGAARNIPAKERGNRGLFPSPKVPNGIVEYESCLERDFFILCHHAPDVLEFQHQPVTISYKDLTRKDRIYTPDAYIEFKDGKKAIFEIKYEEEVICSSDKYKERWDAAKKWCLDRNIIFLVITERLIRTPRWFNVWFTLGSSKVQTVQDYIPDLITLLSEKENESYRDLCYNFSEKIRCELNKSAQIVCYAIYHGLVFVDSFSTEELRNTTIIRKKTKIKESPFVSLYQDFGLHQLDQKKEKPYLDKSASQIGKNIANNDIRFRVPPKYEEKIEFKLKIIKLWLSTSNTNRSVEWRVNFCKKWNLSQSTIYRWVEDYKKRGVEGLIPNHAKAGRESSYDKVMIELLEKSRDYFLKPLISQKKAYALLKDLCDKKGLDIPPLNSFKTYIYRNSDQKDFAKKHGKKYYKSNFTPSLASFQGAFAPMQILQMDNTRFDVFPVDSEYRKQLSTPYMTVAIDCYSRMITGFDISYFPSSSRTVLDVLTNSILPKEKYRQIYNTEQSWPIQGFPVLLLVDNGMDYRSQTLRDFCLKYDIIIEYAPIRTPRYKAYVEQWFNILHKALNDEDISGLRPLLKDRLENPELKPEINATLTLQEITQWVHKWILDEYHFTNPYEDYVPAPYLRFLDFRRENTKILLPLPREPPNPQEEIDLLYLSSLEKDERTLSYEGIVWEHLKYNSRELARLYQKFGKISVEYLLNPRDIRSIWIIDPDTSKPIRVDLGSGWAQAIAKIHGDNPIHASAWKTDLKHMKDRFKSKISPYSYQKEMSRLQREDLLNEAKRKTKSARKTQEKHLETKMKSGILGIKQGSEKGREEVTNLKEKEIPKKDRKDIDWDNLPELWTDDFYSGDLKK